MHVLTVAYGQPSDTTAFDAYYRNKHLPLAQAVPNAVEVVARKCISLDATAPPYYLIAQLSFKSAQDLQAALASPQGQEAAADLANFATGGAALFVQQD